MPHRVTNVAPKCHVVLDRLQVLGWPCNQKPPQMLCGFRLAWDTRVRPQTSIATYGRCRKYRGIGSQTQIYLQYKPCAPWLPPWKVTLIADDKTGLLRSHVEAVIRHCRQHRLLMVELAIDFLPYSGVDRAFVRRHAKFGKTQRNKRTIGLVYGTRKSGKRVHCYRKVQLGVYRVELQLNSALLRANRLSIPDDLQKLSKVLISKHVQFVRIAWKPLRRYLYARFGRKRGKGIFDQARVREYSLQGVVRYLRRESIPNTHRFLRSLSLNKQIRAAVRKWSIEFMTR